jgi:hypothetical protein
MQLAQDPAAVASDESEQCSLGLKQFCAGAILDGQVEKQMAVDNVGMSFALAAPHAGQPTSYPLSKEPLVESFTDFGEELAVGIIKRDRPRPVNRRVGN